MDKIDFRKVYKKLYSAPEDDFALVEVPPLSYLMFDGQGDPNTAPAYVQAIEALYSLSYTLKFMSKRAFGRDYVVGPLEGLWWAQAQSDKVDTTFRKDCATMKYDMAAFAERRKDDWSWTMMILQPDWITAEHVQAAKAEVLMKKGLPGIETTRLEVLEEGLCAQILHVGPYDAEGPALLRLHQDWLPAHGLLETGHHHEIYLSDPRKVAPEKLKTILRQPVKRLDTKAV